MALNVNNNLPSLNIQHSISKNVTSSNRQLQRLSSGLRVNAAVDDASGLAVSEGMRSQAARMGQNVRNAQQASDLLQVAEGSLQEVNNILVRMKELSLQSSTSTFNDRNREAIASEFNQLVSEIDRVAQATAYNEKNLLAGFGNQVSASASTALTTSPATGVTRIALSAAVIGTYTFVDGGGDSEITIGNGTTTQTLDLGTILDGADVATGTSIVANFDRIGVQVTLAGANVAGAPGAYTDGDLNGTSVVVEGQTGGSFQVGPTDGFVNRLEVGIPDLSSSGPTLNLSSLSVSDQGSARSAVTAIDEAVTVVANIRGDIGAIQNRLQFSIGFTESEIENTRASEANIRDADVALEISELSRSQILMQASNAMLVQSNVASIGALALL